ncbi:MAG: hypothetical protein H5T72_08205 [Actinobacteria bacterium]|nr:hypothetical protein [Actinomycetota bacterium]
MSLAGLEAQMAECVSCGKPVEAGKLFCDQCYARMKGRRGPLREAGSHKEKAGEPVERARAREEQTRIAGFPAGERKAREALTPASEKKVVILRPEREKPPARERKSRFTITITFSERTYRVLSRLKFRRENKEGKAGKAEVTRPSRRHKGPHGRPALKALQGAEEASRGPSGKGSGFLAWAAFRSRKLDGRDLASLGMAVLSAASILGLTFTPWVRMTWVTPGGDVAGETLIRGSDLGVLTYVSLAVVLAAAAYIPVSLWLRDRFGYLDFGLVLLAAGLVFVILFYATISSNQRMVDIAFRLAGAGGVAPAENLERHTSWTAYLVSFMGVVLAFSGLARLSERRETREERKVEGKSERVRRG